MEITDEFMKRSMGRAREYSIVLLRRGPNVGNEGADKVIWEHARRNFALRQEGKLSIVCPIRDGSPMAGVGIFDATLEETAQLMDGDPAVKAGVLVYEVHRCRSFPGDGLP